MSLMNSVPSSEIPLPTDELTHISTLASSSSSSASGPVVWKKSSPLKTYSKKTVSPVPSSPVTVSPSLEADNEDKSRYGRARKLIPSGDFLSTDRKVSQYLKIQTENQFHNFRATYSNSKARLTLKKPKAPRKSEPANLSRSFSLTCLSEPEENKDSPKMASILDLAAPTCTETVETPLPLQECESDSDSEPMAPQDYSVGDLVWAAIPTYPYWPAMITRDPVTSLPYKIHGSGNTSRTFWHVHFFGDKGMRGWVVTNNTFVFDGLDSYNNARAKYLSKIAHLSKKKQRALNKAYTIPDSYGKSWVSAVSEAQSLLASPRSDRLEYLISTYASKIETLKKRQRSLSLCDLNMIAKRPRMSEPPQRRNNVVTKTPKALKQASKAEPINPLGITYRPKTVVRAIPTKVPKSSEKLPPIATSAESEVPSTPGRDPLAISPDSALESLDEPSQPPSSETPKRFIPKRKSMESKSAQTSPMKTGLLPLVIESITDLSTMSEQHQVKLEDGSVQSVLVTSVLGQDVMDSSIVPLDDVPDLLTASGKVKKKLGRPRKYPITPKKEPAPKKSRNKLPPVVIPQLPAKDVMDSSIVSLEDVPDLTASGNVKNRLGRPRKHPITLIKEPAPKKSLKKPLPVVVQRASLPVPVVPAKRPRGRPRKTSLPAPSCVGMPGELEKVTITPERAKPQSQKSMPDASSASATPIITRAGRVSNKPVMLSTFTSPKGRKQEPKTNNHFPMPIRAIKEEPVSPSRIKTEPESPAATPKRKRVSEKKKKKKIKLEPNADCLVDASLIKEEPDLSKPSLKVEIPAKGPIREIQRIQQAKKISLFAGVKDGKLCSICFKAGQGVRRCRGPCCLYMHEECSDKQRFVPDCHTAQGDPQRRKKKTRKLQMVDMKKARLEKSKEESSNDSAYSSNGLDKTPSDPEMCSMEIKRVNGITEDSISATDSEADKAEVQIGDDKSTENRIRDDSGLLNVPVSEKSLLNPAKIVDEAESCLNKICRFNGKPTDENNVEEDELMIHMREQDSFPESSGIPTPPPEDNAKSPESPKTNGGADLPLKFDQVDGELVMLDIKADPGNFPTDSAESMTSDASEKDKNDTSKKEGKDNKGWVCNMCQEGHLGPCFACGKDDGDRVRCKAGLCGKVFHLECAQEWPQHTKKHTAAGKLIFYCPAHTCHTCISDNPASLTSRYLNDKLVRCMRCPTTYHHGNFCVPAGSEILTSTQIICPRHFRQGKKSLSPVNASWCFLCSVGGSLICCDLCPNSFHVECLKISPPEGAYICEDCETGRFPLYGEIVWAKLGSYRWWPARILFPLEIPASLQRIEHVPGEFVVRFYGTYNYYWLHRGRVFLFHDGDGKKQESISLHSKKHSEGVFNRGVEEASCDFTIWTGERNLREETQRTSMKPPKYVKITSNKPVGSVKMNEADASSLTACDCKPDHKDPCGPESDCINRLLLVECSPQICPAGEKCNNKNFEKRLYPPLAPFRTEYRGWGLKTLGPLKKGDFIIEYVGEMIDEDEYKRRFLEMQRSKDENFYFLTLDKDRMLDAGPKGNLSRFMNHSCQPNCETQKWTVEGDTRVGLFALQDIPADSELVFNYNLMTTGDKLECRCGAPTCAGFIGGKPNKPPSKPKDDASSNKLGTIRQRGKKKKKTRKKNLAKVALTNSSVIGALSKVPPTKDEVKCYACHEDGATVACQDASCPQLYHLACLGLTKDPSKKWTCPWHECSVCGSRSKVENCSLCINAYCSEHQEGNIVLNRGKGSLCHNHNMSDSGSDWSTGEKDNDSAECGTAQESGTTQESGTVQESGTAQEETRASSST